MPDPLLDAIEQAIDQPLYGRTFENCAVELLRERYYSDLRGTPEMKDMGIDGICGPDSDPEFILVATARRDFARNLRESIKTYVERGGTCRTVVFATSRAVTVDRRRKLQEMLDKRGVVLRAVHDRGDFVHLLYDAPQCRKDLLGVAGAARALSRFPSTARPTHPIPLIGRENDLQKLRDTLGDVVMVGRPGVGKTALLERLAEEGWCLFDSGWDIRDLEDAVRVMRPQRIVIDDSHFAEGRIDALRKLRREMNPEFSIVAVTWPGRLRSIVGSLPDAACVDVEELERNVILSIVEAAGVAGPTELQRTIVDQAYGCAGLAVTLARSCVAGHADEVARGEALLQDLVVWYEKALGEASRHVLGALALAGDHGATLEQVSAITGLDRVTVSDFIRGMAQGGTIDEVRDSTEQRVRVQPEALRYALVRDVFFGGPGSLNVANAIRCLDHPSIAALPIVGAIHRGARVPPNQVLDLVDWDDERTVTAYAALGSSEFRVALDRAPAHRSALAAEAYRAGIDRVRALETLMEQAVSDKRAEHSTPEHPLRVVSDYLRGRDTELEQREHAVRTAEAWLDRGGDENVGVRVLMHAVSPDLRWSSVDPGLGDTLTIWEGAVPKPWIDRLSGLWDLILDFMEAHPALRPEPLLDGLEDWVHPGMIGFGQGPDDETSDAIRAVGTRVVERLRDIYASRPGVLRRLQALADQGELAVAVDVPNEFSALFPAQWRGDEQDGEFEDWQARADDRVRALAEELAGRTDAEIAGLITHADAEAAAAGLTYPRQTFLLAQVLAENTEEPEGLFAALAERRASPDVLLPFLERAAELRRPGWEALVEQELGNPDTAGVAVRVALAHPCEEHLKRIAIEQAVNWPSLVEQQLIRDEVDHETLTLLFDAPDRSLRRRAAVTLGTFARRRRLEDLPEHLRERWRQIIVESPSDIMMFADILKRDDELCADWLRALFGRASSPSYYERLSPDVIAAIAGLPADLRAALVDDIPEGASTWMLQEAAGHLVSEDRVVMAALFARADLESLHGAALRGGPSEAWMNRALLALDHGWEPERIVPSLLSFGPTWVDGEHTIWEQKIADLESLRREGGEPDAEGRELIIAAGITILEEVRDKAVKRERRRRVLGDPA